MHGIKNSNDKTGAPIGANCDPYPTPPPATQRYQRYRQIYITCLASIMGGIRLCVVINARVIISARLRHARGHLPLGVHVYHVYRTLSLRIARALALFSQRLLRPRDARPASSCRHNRIAFMHVYPEPSISFPYLHSRGIW